VRGLAESGSILERRHDVRGEPRRHSVSGPRDFAVLMSAETCQRIVGMGSANDEGTILVTGACGHIGSAVCRVLRGSKRKILTVDVDPDKTTDVVACDLRLKDDLTRLFQTHRIRAVIHLAGILPSAFQADPLAGADVNLAGCFRTDAPGSECTRQTVHLRQFYERIRVVSSRRALTEDDQTMPMNRMAWRSELLR